jgi:mannosyltransferase OCH1-like enzyme
MTREHLRARLAEARGLLAAGDYNGAKIILDEIAADPNNHVLGPLTAFGLPRPLHSALLTLAKRENDLLKRIGYQYTLVPPPELLARHSHFTSAERRELAEAGRQAVPRIIHQIWIGSLPAPLATSAWSEHADRHGYDYRLWREDDLRNAGVYDHPVFAAMLEIGDLPGAVDVARYIILDRFGGIYLDCDWYPARQTIAFHDLLPLVGLTALPEDTPRNTGSGSLLLTNSFIAAPPAHPVFKRILDVLPAVWADLPGAPAWWSTGPLIFTVVCRGGGVTITDAQFVAGSVPRRAPLEAVEALCATAEKDDGGLLLAWKSW